MIVPDFLKKGDNIGVTAPSDGNHKELDYIRLDYAKKTFLKKGFPVVETNNVRTSVRGRSSDAETRAVELMQLFETKEVRAIISAKGGDYLCEMLSFMDWDVIRKNPKWIQGYSDNTGILFTITTLCDIATIYGTNFNDFGMEIWHKAISNNWNILLGNQIEQNSFSHYENGFFDKVTGLEGYVSDKPVEWKNARKEDTIVMEGNLLGGCLDVLLNLVGTRFDGVKSYMQRNEDAKIGTLWFLESFDLNSEALTRGLWQLKEAGWFEYASGFLFGRPCMFETFTDTTYQEAVLSVLGELNVPIILDADIGHKSPQFTMINGKKAKVESSCKRGKLTYQN